MRWVPYKERRKLVTVFTCVLWYWNAVKGACMVKQVLPCCVLVFMTPSLMRTDSGKKSIVEVTAPTLKM